MKRVGRYLLTGLFLLLANPVGADQPMCSPLRTPALDQLVREYIQLGTTANPWPKTDEGGTAIGVWGVAQSFRHRDGRLLGPRNNTAMVDIVNPDFHKKPLPLEIYLQKTPDGDIASAPLIIMAPGIRTGTKGWITYEQMGRFIRRGYHIMALPSPFSDEMIQCRPNTLPGDNVGSSKILLATIRKFVEQIGRKQVKGIHFTGLSYGALLGAMIAAMDAESEDPLLNGNIVLIGPPGDLRKSFEYGDRMIDETLPILKKEGSLATNLRLLRYLLAKGPDDLKPDDIARSLAITYGKAGIECIENSSRQVCKAYPELKPSFPINDTYRARNYFQDFHHLSIEQMPDEWALFNPWLDRGLKAGKKILVLSSDNDPLYPVEIQHPSVVRFPSTAHVGFRYLPVFDDILDLYFGGERDELSRAMDQLVLNIIKAEISSSNLTSALSLSYWNTGQRFSSKAKREAVRLLNRLSDALKELTQVAREITTEKQKIEKNQLGGRVPSVAKAHLARRVKTFLALNSRINQSIDELYRHYGSEIGIDEFADGGFGHYNRKILQLRSGVEKQSTAYAALNRLAVNSGEEFLAYLNRLESGETGSLSELSLTPQYQKPGEFSYLKVIPDLPIIPEDPSRSKIARVRSPHSIKTDGVGTFDYWSLPFYRASNHKS